VAQSRRTTFIAAFRERLLQFMARPDRTREFDKLMRRLKYVNTGGRRFSRGELD